MTARNCGAILLAGAVLAFFPVTRTEFLLWDDFLHLVSNPNLGGSFLSNWDSIWLHSYKALYNPVLFSIWKVVAGIVQAFSPEWRTLEFVLPFLWLNVATHLLNAGLVFQIAKDFSQELKTYYWALIAALIFLLHPIQAESVAWATGFKELVWVTFALLAVRSQQRQNDMLMVLMVCLALLCKPTAVMLPVLLVVLEPRLARRWPTLAMVLAAGAMFWFTKKLQPDVLIDAANSSLSARAYVALDSLGFYFQKLLLPVNLAPDYGRRPSVIIAGGWGLESALGILAVLLTGAAFYFRTWRREVTWMWTPILPVLGLVPFIFQNYSTVADRYIYFSVAGFALFVARSGARWLPAFGRPAIVIVLMLYLVLARLQSEHWRTNESLFLHALKVNPQSFMAENNLGILATRVNNFELAEQRVAKSLALNPLYDHAVRNYGSILLKLKRYKEVEAFYPKYIQLEPTWPELRVSYASALLELEKYEDAIRELNVALKLAPEFGLVHEKMAIALSLSGRHADSIPFFRRAVELEPNDRAFQFNLQHALEKLPQGRSH